MYRIDFKEKKMPLSGLKECREAAMWQGAGY